MSKIIPFDFENHKISAITDDQAEPQFIAKEISSILGYSDAEAMTRRLDDDEKQNLQIVGFGPRGVTVINESGLYSAILGSNKPEAKRFKRWVTHEVLPSIRKTGGYQANVAPRTSSAKLEAEMAGAELYARLLRPAPSSQVAMIAQIVQNNGGDPKFLPAYAIDAAPDAVGGSSMPTKPLKELLGDHGIRMSSQAFNKLLMAAGYLEERSRPSTTSRTGVKTFKAITEEGLRFGKNVTSRENPREVQPHWYAERFVELYDLVTNTVTC
jgi:prophage antirepressor-like protein